MSKNASGLVEATTFFKEQVDEYEKKYVRPTLPFLPIISSIHIAADSGDSRF